MDRRIVTLISASALLAVIVAVVLIAGGSDDSASEADLTDTTVKPVVTVSEDPAPTELVINDIVEGEGPAAKDGDRVSVQYVGALYDTGAEFDASWDRGEPFELTLGGGTVIQGWDQGLVGMKAGGRRELIIPPDLGYGPQGSPPSIPANATLVFIVDMLSINWEPARHLREATLNVIEELLANNRAFADSTPSQQLGLKPSLQLAIVTCMDSRLDVFQALGLKDGEAHVLRNAGGVITDDVIRSLSISQRMLGTERVMLIHHTDCGMQTITDDGFRAELQDATGVAPAFAIESFTDPVADVRQSILRVRRSDFLLHRDRVRGFIYDVDTHRLREVEVDEPAST